MTAVDVTTIAPLARPEAARRAEAEVAAFTAALRELTAEEWTLPTPCALWDVRAMAGHVLGMTETFTGLRVLVTTMRAGEKRAGDRPAIDGVTELQVERTAGLSVPELLDRLAAAGPVNARWRGSRRLLRRLPLKEPMPDGTTETWRLGYLLDRVLTRDTWMHRADLAAATGRPMALTAEHDGRVVADVVLEWAQRHGRPFDLHLTGPAGGRFTQGTGGEQLALDAVELCRVLSGRGTGEGLLSQFVPF